MRFSEFEDKIGQTIYVSATPRPYELALTYEETVKKGYPAKADPAMTVAEYLEGCDGIAEQVIRPTGLLDPKIVIKPIAGQVDDALKEIRLRLAQGERTLVTTLTKRMAEELAEYLSEAGIKVHYLHSEVETMERLEILRDLRLGIYDVVVGINLLREGLDLPEVSLVLILDADKEGFLRSETSLIQTMGRGARHLNGTAIMYADKITGSMQRAITETQRRRAIQEAYNKKHGITPTGIIKAIKESRLAGSRKEVETAERALLEIDPTRMNKQQLAEYVHELTDQMELASSNLEFEKAATLRDEIEKLKSVVKKQKHRI
jgi:excinuclease ABC subunit B